MGKLKCFKLFFRDDKAVFYPGEIVSGYCLIEVKNDIWMKLLSIVLRGVAKVHWTESRNGTRLGTYTEHYNAEVEYVFEKIDLLGSNSEESNCVLREGRHEFGFSFDLPSDGIATSFEGKHGSIRYYVKAEIFRHWTFNSKVKKAFTVIYPADINTSDYLIPSENSVEQVLCCWLCKSGPVSIDAKTDRSGYCPGETVMLSADFGNYSSRSIVPFARLHQVQTYFASGKSRVRETKFTALTGLAVTPGNRASWNSQLLKIPAVSPSINNCCLLKVDYFIKVSLHIPGAYNVSLNLPIVIGTVPFRHLSSYTTMPPLSESSSYLNLPFLDALPPYRETATPPPPFDDPPTYAECMNGAVDIGDEDDDSGEFRFTPMYSYVYRR